MTQLKDGGRQPSDREEGALSASTVIARGQGNGWDEPCKSRGLRTVLWAAGGEIPPADPAPDALLKVAEEVGFRRSQRNGGGKPERVQCRPCPFRPAGYDILPRGETRPERGGDK